MIEKSLFPGKCLMFKSEHNIPINESSVRVQSAEGWGEEEKNGEKKGKEEWETQFSFQWCSNVCVFLMENVLFL